MDPFRHGNILPWFSRPLSVGHMGEENISGLQSSRVSKKRWQAKIQASLNIGIKGRWRTDFRRSERCPSPLAQK